MSSALVKEPKVVRCAIYTRKSTTEGLDGGCNGRLVRAARGGAGTWPSSARPPQRCSCIR
jgi:hypothetical protein